MAWIDLDSAPIPRRTLQRRIKADEIPSMICPSTGRRLVWVSRSDAPSWAANLLAQVDGLQAAVETLTSQLSEARMDIASLRSELKSAKTSAPKPEVLSHRPTSERPVGALSGRRMHGGVPDPQWGAAYDALKAHHGSAAAVGRLVGVSDRTASDWGRRRKRPNPERQAQLLELAKELSAGQAQAA